RAGGAADLAALAAADHWREGRADACDLAESVARAQGARIVRCAVSGEVSDVTAAAGVGAFATEVRARAGPVGPVTPGRVALPAPEPRPEPDTGPGPAPEPVSPTRAGLRSGPQLVTAKGAEPVAVGKVAR
ncbi:hypothetical protein G3I40_41295, partial [Streptomyces sp. SID14478]|nr:hypothetical protein [Streptomyces sp. SID14478]